MVLDLKTEIERIIITLINKSSYKEIARTAETFSSKGMAEATIEFMVKNKIELEWEEAKEIPSMAVAYLRLMKKAHEESHHGAKGTLWRSRTCAWIVQGYRLAMKVSNKCKVCIKRKKPPLTPVVCMPNCPWQASLINV